ncbi:LEA type 2 family protein [bacterium]|nr:LEA type 2 family protein [bacterium]
MRRTAHLLVLCLCLSSAGCCLFKRVIRSPKVEGVRPKIRAIDFSGITLAFDVKLRSRSRIGMDAESATYALEIEGSEFLSGEIVGPLHLPAGETATVTVPCRVTYRDLLRAYDTLIDLPEAHYTLHGTLVYCPAGRRFEIPVSKSGTFPIVRMPKFSDVGFELPRRIPLTGVSLAVSAAVHNPNIFEIDVRDFGYAFELGSARVAALTVTASRPIPAGGDGRVELRGRISAIGTALGLARLKNLMHPKLVTSGHLKTPYGSLKLPGAKETEEE